MASRGESGKDAPATLLPRSGPASASGIAGMELNATPVGLAAGAGTVWQVSDDRELLLVVLEGSARVSIGDRAIELEGHDSLLIARGTRWRMVAGARGVRYLSIHRRKGPIQLLSGRAQPTSLA